ncbi:MAG: CAP domain-containing protein [Gaiellales bacterium]
MAVLAIAIPAAAAAGTTAAKAPTVRAGTLVSSVTQEVNAIRAAHGLKALSVSVDLRRAADTHTQSLLVAGVFSHDSPDGTTFSARLKRFYPPRAGLWTVGENLLMSGPAEPTAAEVVAAWMKSPGHRANLLNPRWRELGVGARFAEVAGGEFGGRPTWLVTLDLGSRR